MNCEKLLASINTLDYQITGYKITGSGNIEARLQIVRDLLNDVELYGKGKCIIHLSDSGLSRLRIEVSADNKLVYKLIGYMSSDTILARASNISNLEII